MAAFEFFRKGDSVALIAKQLQRAESTVSGYLNDYMRFEKITDPSPWVDAETLAQVTNQSHLADTGKLKPLYDHFEGKIGYDQIRIVLTTLKNQNT